MHGGALGAVAASVAASLKLERAVHAIDLIAHESFATRADRRARFWIEFLSPSRGGRRCRVDLRRVAPLGAPASSRG